MYYNIRPIANGFLVDSGYSDEDLAAYSTWDEVLKALSNKPLKLEPPVIVSI